ncbi:transporter [Ganoderma sinense ZZ0214-1]|uniref:Transporter n=1 Tax=Ganoderma sinense ZZ0214-1 TaxID=1077348 RepID=A0A2G8SR30_9APHY|nr:transporter [Ganoderma sinense ZZ0214-1]
MSFAPGPSRYPLPRSLTGSRPGILDPTQPARILREKGATLSFAAFDPLAATGSGNHRPKPRVPDFETAPKRIVIEIPPLGSIGPPRWSEPVIFSEDQWDIYKLDPAYDCFVAPFPQPTFIRRKDPREIPVHTHSSTGSSGAFKKHRLSSPSDIDEPPPGLNKRFRTVVSLVTDEEGTEVETISDSDEEDEVEDIVVEESPRQDPRRADRQKQRRRDREERTQERREKLKAKMSSSSQPARPSTPEIVDLTMEENTPPDLSDGDAGPYATKRKDPESPDQASANDAPQYKPNKRARTRSPGAFRDAFNRKRSERTRRKTTQQSMRSQYEQQATRDTLWAGIFAQTPWATPPSSQTSQAPPPGFDDQDSEEPAPDSEQTDEDARHRAEIEESRRKLAELEKDRPLWEEEARKRQAREQAEARVRHAQREADRRRATEAAAREERQRRQAAAAAAAAEERVRAERARLAREREERRRRERERWSYGPWTAIRAIERYKALSEAFDTAKFTADNPVDFEMVPWPVLHAPAALTVEDIDWASVEAFFEAARRHLRTQDYRMFVEKAHKRFHPDRWRARGVLKSLEDEELRGGLEVAANTVSQAVTPIWREMRG